MPASGVYLGSRTADDILTDAWERIGKNTAELTGEVARSAKRSLDDLQVEWTNRGLNLWQVDQQTLTLAIGANTYALPSPTVETLDVTLTVGGQERTLSPLGRADYSAIPEKTSRGTPNQYWCNRAAATPTLYLYPTPDAALTLAYWRFRQPQAIAALGNTVDAPALWSDALCAGLAVRLATKYSPDRLAFLVPQAAEAVAYASQENRQRVNLRMLPRFSR